MIRLGKLKLKTPVIQSPMAGCTDLAFRQIAREFGMELAYLEMISCESLVRDNRKTLGLMKTAPWDRPIGCQLVGAREEAMGEAARIAKDMGFDLIDINMGCPVPKITKSGAGSALMKDLRAAGKIMGAVRKGAPRVPVTVKMRKGYEDDSGKEAVELARIAEAEGLEAVAVHGRTRLQGYSGKADWRVIAKVKAAVKVPVFGNGDVNSGWDAGRMLEETGCDGVMLGRGALGNPWIYRQAEAVLRGGEVPPKPSFEEKKEVFLRHFDLELKYEGPRTGLLNSRTIACWYFKGYPGAAKLRAKINRLRTADKVREAIEGFRPAAV